MIAGAALCAAGVLIPAAHDLREVRVNEERLAAALAHLDRRVAAHESFLAQVRAGDPILLRRLAAAQLNLAPAGARLILDGGARLARIDEWIESAAGSPLSDAGSPRRPPTLLERLALGPQRLWFLAVGVLGLFIGLVLDCRTQAAPLALGLTEDPPELLLAGGRRRRGAITALLTPVSAPAARRAA